MATIDTNTTRQYVGARYVPKLMGAWNELISYEALSIVTYNGNSFTSKVPVPAGTPLDNEEYWVETGIFNQQVEELRKELVEVSGEVAENKAGLDIIEANKTTKSVWIVGNEADGNPDLTNWPRLLMQYSTSLNVKRMINTGGSIINDGFYNALNGAQITNGITPDHILIPITTEDINSSQAVLQEHLSKLNKLLTTKYPYAIATYIPRFVFSQAKLLVMPASVFKNYGRPIPHLFLENLKYACMASKIDTVNVQAFHNEIFRLALAAINQQTLSIHAYEGNIETALNTQRINDGVFTLIVRGRRIENNAPNPLPKGISSWPVDHSNVLSLDSMVRPIRYISSFNMRISKKDLGEVDGPYPAALVIGPTGPQIQVYMPGVVEWTKLDVMGVDVSVSCPYAFEY